MDGGLRNAMTSSKLDAMNWIVECELGGGHWWGASSSVIVGSPSVSSRVHRGAGAELSLAWSQTAIAYCEQMPQK